MFINKKVKVIRTTNCYILAPNTPRMTFSSSIIFMLICTLFNIFINIRKLGDNVSWFEGVFPFHLIPFCLIPFGLQNVRPKSLKAISNWCHLNFNLHVHLAYLHGHFTVALEALNIQSDNNWIVDFNMTSKRESSTRNDSLVSLSIDIHYHCLHLCLVYWAPTH